MLLPFVPPLLAYSSSVVLCACVQRERSRARGGVSLACGLKKSKKLDKRKEE